MNFIGEIIELVLGVFIVLLFVRLIVDWIQFFARSWVPQRAGARRARGRLLGHRPAGEGAAQA